MKMLRPKGTIPVDLSTKLWELRNEIVKQLNVCRIHGMATGHTQLVADIQELKQKLESIGVEAFNN